MHTNRLINESSPYLLQHAHNPVDWFPWGEEAFEKAAREDKPVLVSIGYAACHWCHVMEKESFEDEQTAALMNERFVNIKIDREERPDLDHIYMEAVQAISGSGGWPLNVFLTPGKKPFYGGTYFPPAPAHNRPSWKDVLKGISDMFREKKDEIDRQAESLTDHIIASNSFGVDATAADQPITEQELAEMFTNLIRTADTLNGGFGRAPKFPQTFSLRYLLHYYHFTGNLKALDQVRLSADRMIDGGINDQLGGGFARYATDEQWLVPHFEKMLYDNALLVILLGELYQVTGNNRYAAAINTTLDFVEREMFSAEGLFFSALDADSEGEEGKYYVWSKQEVDNLLGPDAAVFSEFYNISERGNWEQTNILHVTRDIGSFAATHGLEPGELQVQLEGSTRKLLAARSKRVPPLTDDKMLVGWNALLNTACSKAYMATGNEKYRSLAIRNMEVLLEKFTRSPEGELWHTYKNGVARYPAFLDDYAQVIQALLHLQEITGERAYLEKVKTLVKWCIDHFSQPETGYFYFTNDQQEDVIVRKIELYDGAVPSGNSLMAWNLYYSGVVFDNSEWRKRAVKMCSGMKEVVKKYPGSFGVWAMLMLAISKGVPEIVVTGGGKHALLQELLAIFIPYRILQSSPDEAKGFPLLEGKSFLESPTIYLCKDYSCQTPVNQVAALRELLKNW